MNEHIHPDDAARSLAEVRRRKEQIVALSRIPGWFRWTVALLAVVLAAGLDSRRPLLIGVGTTVFVLGLLIALGVIFGRGWSRATPRHDLLGPRAGLVIVAFVGLVLLVNLPTTFLLQAAGSPLPATVGAVAGGVVMIVGGPIVARYLRRLADDGR
ncbi:hypothetical protein AB0M54_16315 [Actinoplanes sp. NPDC051470]|uniref:hypothetical protein n=1 Tax=unclassified Actinoplanes TaxID=2626549 RepID=UPI00342F6E62